VASLVPPPNFGDKELKSYPQFVDMSPK
jgi:hypothetical protein